jgi:hypothetical protein
MTTRRKLATLFLTASLSWASPVSADVVTDWNVIALQTLAAAVPPRPAPTPILDLAMMHVAMHDAIEAFEGRFESYAAPIANASGSPEAAAAQAAHDVLAARFPLQAGSLNTVLASYLANLGLTGDAGLVTGQQAALQILQLRANDGSFPANPEIFVGSTEPGQWRPTLPAFAPMSAPWFGAVAPFTLKKDSEQLLASPPPPHLTSGKYLRDYNEVKALGSINSTARTQEQTDLALFYSDNFLVQWQGTLRGIVDANIDDIGDSARLFALANMAAADAIISAWANKRYWNFWRPITAIQEGDNDGNPRTVGDPSWLPFLPTPPYSDYTSGANDLTGAMTRTLERYFGDTLTFSVTSTSQNQTKTYDRFSDMAADVVNVRIYHGVHFRSADEVARRQGIRTADWAFSHILRPID